MGDRPSPIPGPAADESNDDECFVPKVPLLLLWCNENIGPHAELEAEFPLKVPAAPVGGAPDVAMSTANDLKGDFDVDVEGTASELGPTSVMPSLLFFIFFILFQTELFIGVAGADLMGNLGYLPVGYEWGKEEGKAGGKEGCTFGVNTGAEAGGLVG
jgi:hypothetical protein